jgi:hypothetical protein
MREAAMGDTQEGRAWVPSDGFPLCAESSCGEPKATGPTKDNAEWECEKSDHCKPKGERHCGRYLVLVRPRSRHVPISAAMRAIFILTGTYSAFA